VSCPRPRGVVGQYKVPVGAVGADRVLLIPDDMGRVQVYNQSGSPLSLAWLEGTAIPTTPPLPFLLLGGASSSGQLLIPSQARAIAVFPQGGAAGECWFGFLPWPT